MAPIRHLLLLFLLALIALFPLVGNIRPVHAETVNAEEQSSPETLKEREALVRNLANVTLSILQDQKKDYADREELMARGISNMVDIDWIARFVLGSAWKTATDEQRERYTALYRTYFTRMYISNFAQSRERKVRDIKIIGVTDSEKSSFIARTVVALSTGETLSVDYRVREANNTRRIIDVVIEGVSLLTSHRAEFSKMAASGGVEGVIARLEELKKSATPDMTLSMKGQELAVPGYQAN